MTATITYTKGQFQNGDLFLNMNAGPEEASLSASGCVYGNAYHLIAWSRESNIQYTVVQVAAHGLEDWWRNNRRYFNKVLQIVPGGVQNLPDELITRLNKLLEKEA
jgi:hypothetical protein